MEYEELGFGKVDLNRQNIKGFPEIIYGEYKTPHQILKIAKSLIAHQQNVLISRLNREKWEILKTALPEGGTYDEEGEIYTLGQCPHQEKGSVVILSGGTADYFVTAEAKQTAEWMGLNTTTIQDVGVAGLGRLLSKLEVIRKASVVVVIAGMEGALPSVVSGLVDTPVIAVPTSVGYGANLQGITTLLAMLTSCSSGISVVNVNNGFGAAYQAALIIKLMNKKENKG